MKKKRRGKTWHRLTRFRKNRKYKRLVRAIGTPAFAKFYLVFCLLTLGLSAVFWSLLSARVQTGNADQLINRYLFENPSSLTSAVYPAAHTFLLKWPLFVALKFFGPSAATLSAFTVGVVLATVSLLAFIIYRIERRPLVFGTLCLGLASVLLLVPAEARSGSLLPVNMAMLATRNLEYVLFIAAVYLFARSARLRSWGFWLAVLLMGILAASDKLYLILGLGGALLALVVYALSSGWNLVSLTVRWLVGGVIAGLAGLAILWWLNWSGVTHLIAQGGAGPYGLVQSLHQLILGAIYAFFGLLTNFGANPAFNTSILHDIPQATWHGLIGVSGLAYVVNFLILAAGVFAAWRLIAVSLAHNKSRDTKLKTSSRLSIMLIWASVAAVGVFIIGNHNYAGDARYLTIVLFALFISAASYASGRKWRPEASTFAGGVIVLAIVLALPTVVRAYNKDESVLAPINYRNFLVAQALKHHQSSVLVGDYWRVVPTKLASGGGLNIAPLSGCLQFRDALTSQAWQHDLSKQSFAYLLTLDGSQTDYPSCTLDQITKAYGRPNSSALIAGSFEQPKELVLFYDHGINKSSPKTTSTVTNTVLPITLDELPHTYCSVPTDMNIVAHEDDDLLFMTPHLAKDLKSGHCVRTIYITAGDAGGGQFYWLGRQQGSEAAYATALGSPNNWLERIVKLNTQQYITVASLAGNNDVSLIFFHLPDGNLKGQGFVSSHFESLAKLDFGQIPQLNSIDNQSVYTSAQLVDALTMLMHAYQPADIKTQANLISDRFPDHSDHMAVGRFVKKAYANYETQQYENRVSIPLEFYIGYPVHELPANVFGDDLGQKEAMFVTYSKYDGGVCQSLQRCLTDPAYGAFLIRQYQNDY